MSKLFIYYSHTGNGDLVAEALRKQGYELRKAVPRRDLPKSFAASMLKGGFLAGIGHKSKLKGYDSDVSGYDEVIIGTPVWNGKVSCPVNTVLSETDLTNKKLAFVLYSGGGSAPKAVKKLKEKYDCPVFELREPLKNPDELNKLGQL
ncbi:MAG: hypothetical protein IJK33_06095 [Clostridia bacterium]|nr:hypothetical protein [Clostridia bacterium]MBQ6183440.1 hypothetical protein [Clostridia bacterium]